MSRRFWKSLACAAAMSAICATAALRAAEPPAAPAGLFPFTIPWDNASPGLTNLSAWLEKPAGKSGFIVAKDGHLHAGDRRIRLLGVNLCFDACFPSHDDADRIAPRMARFGINAVRFHHMDTSSAPHGLLKNDRRTLDPAQLDRLDYLLSRLKATGIYADLNLHVGRNYPGLPIVARDHYDKGLDNFVPQMIESQREYARALLTHLNPYTRTRYCDEPAVALIEINNENGLIREWLSGSLDDLPPVYRDELARQWNEWLATHYANADALRSAWATGGQPLTEAELLSNGDFAHGEEHWGLEQHDGAQATMLDGGENGPGGCATLKVSIQRPGAERWHVQLAQSHVRLEAGKAYTLSFQARSDRARTIVASVGQAHEPWHAVAFTHAAVGPDWRAFRLVFVANETDENARSLFNALGQAGDSVQFARVSLRAGGVAGLRPGEGLGKVAALPHAEFGSRTPTVQRDWVRFLWDTEERYWTGMRRFIRDDLKCGSLVIGTQNSYSPFPIQAEMDVTDWHAYWQHPNFPGRPWDPVNWTVRNEPMAGAPDGGTLDGMLTRAAGKPFVCTEYNSPAPNTYSSEAFLLLGAYAALHDLDGIFAFAYSHTADWNHGTFQNFFDIAEHPTKMVTLPAVAAMFERADVRTNESAVVSYTTKSCIELIRKSGGLPTGQRLGVYAADVFQGPVQLELSSDAETAAHSPKPAAAVPRLSITGELIWAPKPISKEGVVAVNTPRSMALIGASNDNGAFGFCGGVKIMPGKTLQNWSAITLTAVDGESLKAPARILLTATGYVQNTGMVWKDARHDSVGKDWGHAPPLVEGIPAKIVLPLVEGTKARAWALDGRGQRGQEIPLKSSDGTVAVEIGPDYRTLWYEIELAK